ncbi:MAG: glutamate--tRNA ligase [Marinilabiliales bacterium]
MNQIRVRFAPSPTGPLHIGGVRTALFNYLFAKKNNGINILRIEDTDQTRYVPGAEEYIIESLKWCGIKFDEGVTEGGNYGPYRQSERKTVYKEFADYLIENGYAYYGFDTPEELDNYRKEAEKNKSVFAYGIGTRENLKNSLTLSKQKVNQLINDNTPYVIRFKIPENKTIVLNDIIRGEVSVQTNTLDDKVLFKSDGMPTYHLANIVDDHLMRITHVIRGEEWLPSLPLHWLLYDAFDWEKPQFAHLPLILKPDGKGKLSKRDGERLGFPVFPIEWNSPDGEKSLGFREFGYFPEAFINMLALLGWNPGNDKEIMSLEEMIELFSIERVSKSGAKFDPEKAKWFNNQYLQKKSNTEIAKEFNKILIDKGINVDFDKLEKIVALSKERVSFIKDLWEQTKFFFEPPVEYDAKTVKKQWKENTPGILLKLQNEIKKIEKFNRENVEPVIKGFVENNSLSFGQVMTPLRLALVGGAKGPDLIEIIILLGKEETIDRVNKAIAEINT